MAETLSAGSNPPSEGRLTGHAFLSAPRDRSTPTTLAEIQSIFREFVGAQLPRGMIDQFGLNTLRWQRPQRSPAPSLPIFFAGAPEEIEGVQQALVTLGIADPHGNGREYHSDNVQLAAVTTDTRGSKRVIGIRYSGFDDFPAVAVDISVAKTEGVKTMVLDPTHTTRFPTSPGSITGSYDHTNGYITEAMVRQAWGDVGGHHIPAIRFYDPSRSGNIYMMQIRYGNLDPEEYRVRGTSGVLWIGYCSEGKSRDVVLPRTLQKAR